MNGYEFLINIIFYKDLDEEFSLYKDDDIESLYNIIENHDYFLKKYKLTLQSAELEPYDIAKRGCIIFSGYDEHFEMFYMKTRDFKIYYLELMKSKKILIDKGIELE